MASAQLGTNIHAMGPDFAGPCPDLNPCGRMALAGCGPWYSITVFVRSDQSSCVEADTVRWMDSRTGWGRVWGRFLVFLLFRFVSFSFSLSMDIFGFGWLDGSRVGVYGLGQYVHAKLPIFSLLSLLLPPPCGGGSTV